MKLYDELSEYLVHGVAVQVDGIQLSSDYLEHTNLILKEDDSYMKEFHDNEKGEICAVNYIRIRE